jgi:secretion/DNA translocation related TadE-like protein
MRPCPAPLSAPLRQRGSGTVSGLGIIVGVVSFGMLGLGVSAGLVEAKTAQTVSNQAALAASDVSRGVVAGHPCRVASSLVREAGFQLLGCDVDHGKAWIVVGGQWWGIDIEKRSHAGPADHPVFLDSQ